MEQKHTPGPWNFRAFKVQLKGWIAQIFVDEYNQWFDMSGCPIFKTQEGAIHWGIDYIFSHSSIQSHKVTICETHSHMGFREADANERLIAAAPEMLEALYIAEKALINNFECFNSEHGPILNPKTFVYLYTLDEVIKYAPSHVEELISVREAIAKATGKQH